MYVTLYRCVLSIPHIVFPPEHVILWRGSWFLWVPVYHHSLWHVSFMSLSRQKAPERGEYFLPGTIVYCESLFSALLRKLTRALNLSVFDHGHTNKAYWIISTFYLEGGEMRRVIFFSFFLCSTLQQSLSLFSYCISTEYGVDIKIL